VSTPAADLIDTLRSQVAALSRPAPDGGNTGTRATLSAAQLRELCLQHLEQTQRVAQALHQLIAQIDALNRQPWTDEWWQALHGELADAAAGADPTAALALWQQHVVAALADWRLDALQQLVNPPYAGTAAAAGVLPVYVAGVNALLERRGADALPMLDALLAAADSETFGISNEQHAALLLVAARAVVADDSEAALQRLRQAAVLAPDDARIDAAQADCHRREDPGPVPRKLYKRALARQPGLPDAHVGLGLLLEDKEEWDEADDRYRAAIESLRASVPDAELQAALARWLAPVSGNLYLQLGRMLKRDAPEAALAAVTEALELGVRHSGEAPERLGHRLRGEILESLGRTQEAAEAYRSAANGYLTRSELAVGLPLLRTARELDPTDPMTCWVLADALRMSATISVPPYVDRDALDAARATWETGIALRLPIDREAWIYAVAVGINEQRVRLRDRDANELYWESVCWLERSLLLRDWDGYRWSELAQTYRTLRLWANALHASNVALEKDASNNGMWEERIVLLSHLGRWQETREALDKRREAVGSSAPYWDEGVVGYLHYLEGRPDLALEHLDNAVSQAPDDVIWCQDSRASCLRVLGQTERALADYEAIWSKYQPELLDNRELFGIAAYELGHVEEARAIFTDLQRMPAERAKAEIFLGLCHFMQGEVDAGRRLLETAIDSAEPVELMELQRLNLRAVAERAPAAPGMNEAIRSLLERSGQRLAELQDPGTPEAELERVLLDHAAAVGMTWLGATAGLARLHLEHDEWRAAAQLYEQLSAYQQHLPEAMLGLNRALAASTSAARTLIDSGETDDAVIELRMAQSLITEHVSAETRRQLHDTLAEALLRRGDAQGALQQLQQSLTLAHAANDAAAQAQLRGRIGYAWLVAGDERQAADNFAGALQEFFGNSSQSPGADLAAACTPLLAEPRDYWRLADAWNTAADAWPVESLRTGFAAAREALNTFLQTFFRMTGQSSVFPMVTPITLDLATNIVPEDDDAEAVLMQTFIPEMRARIETELGVEVPGVRVSGNDQLFEDAYVITLDEVPLVLGTVDPESAYCPAPPEQLQQLGVPPDELEERPHPVTRKPGCFVPRAYHDSLREHGLELWTDPRKFVVAHVEAVLRANITNFLGVQEVEKLLEGWAASPEDRSLIDSVLPDAAARFRFARLLRALAQEGVSIADWRTILSVVRDSPTAAEMPELVRSVRHALRPVLPGNQPDARRAELPQDFEDQVDTWLWTMYGKTFFALPPEDTQDLLADIRALVSEHDEQDLVLVVRDGRLRPYLRRLVELEFPRLMVLAADELWPEQAVAAGQPAEGARSNV
jgi:tetratricopeptide (TPR) repeat protein